MRLLKKRWHSIPVVLVAVLLALALTTGGVFAAYGFLTTTLSVQVEEAIVVGMWDTWDNLEPYGSVDDVDITLGGTPGAPTIIIATIPGYAGAGFVAGEYIVIPVNFRNAGDGELNLEASVTGGGGRLTIEQTWEENLGNVGTLTTESGQLMCREFKATETFAALNGWTGTIDGNGGKSGSAVVGAQVLFVKISAPGDAIPGTYTWTVTLSRS
ncbi:hypothetical protein ES703_84711 [subsurface metagenome]